MTSAILQRNSIQKFLSTTCCNRLVSRSYSSQKTLTRASSSSQSAASSSKDVLSSTHGPVDFVTHEELPSHDDYPPSGSHSQRRRDTNQRNKGGRRRIKADDRPYIEPVIAPSLPLPTGKTYVTRLGPLPAPEERGTLLNHLQVSSTEPTLADLQAFRPQEMPGLGSPEYAKVYKTVREQISSSFTKAQMRSFEMLYVQGDISLSKPKMRIVEDIMEKAWGMPSPSKVERDRKEQKEVKSATLPVSAAQLFLLLGKDGSELLHLATEHGVHVSVASSPLSLTVRGVKKENISAGD
ncbi:hypothetical protein SISSUDRAFT_306351 [Sistotremastrum suecicum HHB10207 ss-3]|uniref:Uncharacterized protein n=1 Tax=Sistotremastrum suecicum HHB10207 ss-3 TaxID=1314776 RepID=A0A166G7S1_9AGAM|nr:hypothetical protein SISSUDRAFT_306351 [Sistotremastrum suecicum HHB10207 ss-3]